MVKKLVTDPILPKAVPRTDVHIHHPESVHGVEACLRTSDWQVWVKNMVTGYGNLDKVNGVKVHDKLSHCIDSSKQRDRGSPFLLLSLPFSLLSLMLWTNFIF